MFWLLLIVGLGGGILWDVLGEGVPLSLEGRLLFLACGIVGIFGLVFAKLCPEKSPPK